MNELNTDTAVMTSGFIIGFASVVLSRKDALQYPLSAMVSACLCGIFCRIGAELLNEMLFPKQFRFLFPVMATASCGYYLHKTIKQL